MPDEQTDADLAKAYDEDRSLLDPVGPGRAGPRPKKLGNAVPVRFSSEMIERIKAVAAREELTVSGWIRREIQRALAEDEVRRSSSVRAGPDFWMFMSYAQRFDPQAVEGAIHRLAVRTHAELV